MVNLIRPRLNAAQTHRLTQLNAHWLLAEEQVGRDLRALELLAGVADDLLAGRYHAVLTEETTLEAIALAHRRLRRRRAEVTRIKHAIAAVARGAVAGL